MRHYVIHFWQQLPHHVEVDLETLRKIDCNYYSTLEDIYLHLNSSPDQLKHLYAIARLNPLWLEKALVSCDEAVKKTKTSLAIKWKSKIKNQYQLLEIIKVSQRVFDTDKSRRRSDMH